MAYENVLLEREERIAILSINRPKAINALNKDTLLEINIAIDEIKADDDIDVVIVTGTGDKAFVAGADISFMQNLSAVEALAPEELMEYVKKIAKRIISKAPVAVRLSKVAANEGMQVDIDRGMTIEADAFGLCFATTDQKEGMTAFAEKRKAHFTGK